MLLGKRNAGVTLVEVMMALGLMTILGLSIAATLQIFSQRKSTAETWAIVGTIRQNLRQNLNNPLAITKTIDLNTDALATCLKANRTTPTDCSGATNPVLMTPYDATGQPVSSIAKAAATDGLTWSGENCNLYGINPAACPLRYELTWKAVCPPSPAKCFNPKVEFASKLNYQGPTGKTPFNMNEFSFNVTIQDSTQSWQISCTSLGGTVSGNTCNLKLSNQNACPAGTFATGFQKDFTIVCKAPVDFRCPVGGLISSIDQFGNITCMNGCSGAGSGAGTLSFQ